MESRSLSVVWGTVPCSQQRGPITGYSLHYNSSSGSSSVNITGEENRQYTLTGLTPYTSYTVQVAAVNDGGTGPYSDPFIVETLQEAPTAAAAAAGATAAVLMLLFVITIFAVVAVVIKR